MIRYIAEMPSYTYARKAVKILSSRGYACRLSRREENCGYDIVIQDKSAFELLTKYGIPYKPKGDS